MDFALITAAGVLALILIFVALGRWYPVSGAEVLDWRPTRSYEDEIRLEMEDIDQMLEAQNERRRASGRPELTEDQMRDEVARAEAEQSERAARYESERGDGI